MLVVRAQEFGAPEVLATEELPDLMAGPGQVVIDVAVADTLFLDVLIRRGGAEGPWPVRPPYIPGAGVAGTVRAVGEGVAGTWLGRRVIAKSGAGGPRQEVETIAAAAARTPPVGGYAEQALAWENALVPVPDGLGLPEAAALVNDGMTAVLLTEAIGIRPGERVLITPAGGGLGCLLVQLARLAGAEVVAAARGSRKLALARELGAHQTVDYSDPDWPALVRGVDVALDGVGGSIGRASFDLTVPGGRFLAFGVPGGGFTMVDPAEATARNVRHRSLLDLEWSTADERGLPERALAMAIEGRIRPVIGSTLPLVRAAAAHAAIESRSVTGKTLLSVR